jgi:Zn-dependent protease with chaperone function
MAAQTSATPGPGRGSGTPTRPWTRALAVLAALLAACAWVWCAHELWGTIVPADLQLPHVDVHRFFSASLLHRNSSYERFLDIDGLLEILAPVAVLAVYACRGQRLMRESAAGRIGTGIMLALLGFALVWLAEVPFDLAALWWERRHHVLHEGYVAGLLGSFLWLGERFVWIALAVALAMALAGKMRRWWWVVAAPLFAVLALLSALLTPYLITTTHPLRDPALVAEARTLEAREGVTGTPVLVGNLSRTRTEVNAETAGIGPSQRVVLWSTLLDGHFTHAEIGVVMSHEFGHVARAHVLKEVGWLALFLIPATALVALATRRRGGLGRPEAVPVAILVFVVLELVTLPFFTLVSRRYEAEADWSSLQATHKPAATRQVFERLASTNLSDPDPPTWAYLLYAQTPTLAQRIAMTEAWEERASR